MSDEQLELPLEWPSKTESYLERIATALERIANRVDQPSVEDRLRTAAQRRGIGSTPGTWTVPEWAARDGH